MNSSLSNQIAFIRFLLKRQWNALNDSGLSKLSSAMLRLFYVHSFVFLVTTILIFAPSENGYTSQQVISSLKPAILRDQQDNWVLLTGKWYGSQPTRDSGIRKELMERSSDGKYIVRLHCCPVKKLAGRKEA